MKATRFTRLQDFHKISGDTLLNSAAEEQTRMVSPNSRYDMTKLAIVILACKLVPHSLLTRYPRRVLIQFFRIAFHQGKGYF
jgi:hypothetical protein